MSHTDKFALALLQQAPYNVANVTPSLAAWAFFKYPGQHQWYFAEEWTAIAQLILQCGTQPLPVIPKPAKPRCDPRHPASTDSNIPDSSEESIAKPLPKVYTDYDFAKLSLVAAGITVVESAEDCDFMILTKHVKDFLSISPTIRVAQFPYEGGFVRKDLLGLTVRTYCYRDKREPKWWQPYYDLSTEFHLFANDIIRRNQNGHKNHWILKPSQGTRGLGHYILTCPKNGNGNGKESKNENIENNNNSKNNSDNSNKSTAMSQSLFDTWDTKDISMSMLSEVVEYYNPLLQYFNPRQGDNHHQAMDIVAQLIVDKPLTVFNRKFDLRVFVFVRSFEPFEAYLYRFYFARLANKVYCESELNDFEVILTVNAYNSDESIALKQERLTREQLKTQLQFERPELDFADMELSMSSMLSELFGNASEAIGHWPQSSAYYAVDVIFDTEKEECQESNSSNSGGSSSDGQSPLPSQQSQQSKETSICVPIAKVLEVNFMGDWKGVKSAAPDDMFPEVDMTSWTGRGGGQDGTDASTLNRGYLVWVRDLVECLGTNNALDSSRFQRL